MRQGVPTAAELEEARSRIVPGPSGEPAVLTPLFTLKNSFLYSDLQNCVRIDWCCSKPLHVANLLEH